MIGTMTAPQTAQSRGTRAKSNRIESNQIKSNRATRTAQLHGQERKALVERTHNVAHHCGRGGDGDGGSAGSLEFGPFKHTRAPDKGSSFRSIKYAAHTATSFTV